MIGAHPELMNESNDVENENRNKTKIQKKKDECGENGSAAAEGRNQQTSDVDTDDEEISEYTCPKCFKLFFSQKNVKRHVKTQHEQRRRLPCPDCEKTFASSSALTYHKKRVHSEGRN